MIDEIIALLEKGDSEEALRKLKSLKENTRGIEKLGQSTAVVITYPTQADAEVIDSVRYYVAAMFGGNHDAANLRTCTILCSEAGAKVMPDWFMKTAGWVDKDAFTHLMYQTLVEVDLLGDTIKTMPDPYNFDESKLREKLLFEGTIKSINAPLPSTVLEK